MRKMNKAIIVICSCLILGTAAINTQAGDYQVKRYPLAGHGYLQVRMPILWTDHVKQPPDNLPPTITFTARNGNPFVILLTPIWAMDKRPPLSLVEMRAHVAQAAEHAQAQAVETHIAVQTLTGQSGKGYYFQATDRAPKPDEYKYITQGFVQVGKLPVAFTILTNDGQEVIQSQALGLIAGLEYQAQHNK